ncbi:MAG: hypothetical protein AAGI38_20760 [Bacteroidota bacterium]
MSTYQSSTPKHILFLQQLYELVGYETFNSIPTEEVRLALKMDHRTCKRILRLLLAEDKIELNEERPEEISITDWGIAEVEKLASAGESSSYSFNYYTPGDQFGY